MNIEIKKITCERCGYEWVPRVEDIKRCPGCKSPYWQKPKINKDYANEQDQTAAL